MSHPDGEGQLLPVAPVRRPSRQFQAGKAVFVEIGEIEILIVVADFDFLRGHGLDCRITLCLQLAVQRIFAPVGDGEVVILAVIADIGLQS